MNFFRNILQRQYKFHMLKQENGAIAVEFIFCFMPILLLFFFILEISRIYLISSALDLSIAESAKFSSIYSGPNSYQSAFTEKLEKNLSTYVFLSSENTIKTESVYCKNLDQLINHFPDCNDDSTDKKLVIHTLEYKYTPILFYFTDKIATNHLKREVISVLEHQRNIK